MAVAEVREQRLVSKQINNSNVRRRKRPTDQENNVTG